MKNQKAETYRLHIDHEPVAPARISLFEPHPLVHAGVGHHASGGHHISSAHHAGAAGRSKFAAFVWDKLQFVFVSAGVFVVIYVFLNWQALLLNAQHYWNVFRGFESPLTKLVETTQPAPEKLPVPEAGGVVGSLNSGVPPLAIEVYPTDMRLIIPRINQNVPVIGVKNENLIAQQWDNLEADIQQALRNGVIHYPGTALPGDNGNVVITGHSSYYAWDPGRFKDVFSLLHDVNLGDKVVVYFNQKKFIYEVFNIKVVMPKDVDVLGSTNGEQLTLITCTPIGTNLKRLVVEARLLSKE